MKTFTKEELAKYDGLEGRAPYVAYLGKVYDMTDMPEADHGDHFGHPFGLDLTEVISNWTVAAAAAAPEAAASDTGEKPGRGNVNKGKGNGKKK